MSRRGPILIEDDEAEAPRITPAEAPPVPDAVLDRPQGQAMRTLAALGARRSSALVRWFWRALGALIAFWVSVAAWSAIEGLLARSPILGWTASVLVAVVLVTLLGICIREVAALARLEKMERLHRAAESALAASDLKAARAVTARLAGMYRGRDAMRWHVTRFDERQGDVFDVDALFDLAEGQLLEPLDAAARIEIEAAARTVATVTAVVPLALADVAAAATSNLRMIRRIAEIYGGRAGTIEAWRLTRAVLTHLVATGAVAVGDDLIGSVAGGSMLSRVSRRFGEGVVNGALTARVGVAAMEVCRPLPFTAARKPQVHRLVGRALAGLFPGSRSEG